MLPINRIKYSAIKALKLKYGFGDFELKVYFLAEKI